MSSSLSTERQLQIYRQGSLVPLAAEALEAKARAVLPVERFDYLSGGAGAEATMQANLEAFQRWRIEPRWSGHIWFGTSSPSLNSSV